MDPITVLICCDAGHEQTITFRGRSEAWVQSWCGLIDGSSPFYQFPPGPESLFGKCAICGKPIKAEILA